MKLLSVAWVVLMISTTAACVDSTLPRTERDSAAAQARHDYLLPPIVVVVPHCDPWTDLNWCEAGGGTCMTSTDSTPAPVAVETVAGCDPGGGGGSGGGTVPPDTTKPPAENDYDPNMAPPDCTKPVLANWEHAYCNSQPPTGQRLTRTLSALQRIADRGGECANIAAVAQGMLNAGTLRYFEHDPSIHGNYGGWGDPDLGALLATMWVDDFGGTALGFPNFDNKVIHEVEHAMGRSHYPESNSDQTPNSLRCSGLG